MTATAETPEGGADTPPPIGARRLRRTVLGVLVVTVLAQLVGFGVSYLGPDRHVVSTENAQVDGNSLYITAPTAGILTRWTATPGANLQPDQLVGRITLLNIPTSQPQRPIRAPSSGIVALDIAEEGQYVQEGARLAVVIDPDSLFVTARFDEPDVRRVRPGQPVTVVTAGRHDLPVHGVVQSVQSSTAGAFSPFPSPDIDPTNPQAEQQYVPVRIAVTDTEGVALIPGTDATVHIRTDP